MSARSSWRRKRAGPKPWGWKTATTRAALVVVAGDVVDEADCRMVADERAVGLARLGDREAFSRARHETAARALAREIGAAQHGGLDASLTQEPSDHADDCALATRARDGDTRRSGVDHLGE